MPEIKFISKKSRPVIIIEYQSRWFDEFSNIGHRLRSILENEALRIDHIGSTSVPGLGAKDIIDIQITVSSLENMAEFENRMKAASFIKRGDIQHDNFCGIEVHNENELRKMYYREPEGERRCHIHVRQKGYLNQRYALLFRDYLRSNSVVRTAYELIKRRLSKTFPESIDGYLHIKDPLMDIIFEGAQNWASQTNWKQDDLYL